MNLHQWAAYWNIQPAAVADLQRIFGMDGTNGPLAPAAPVPPTEGGVQTAVRLEAGRKRILLFRNNVGALEDKDGRHVRFGLANDSPVVNKRIKSADLIGIRPVTVTQQHVGQVIGQFVSREIKAPGWHYAATDREVAQLRWIEIITANGGDACFATGEGTL